MQIQIRIDVSVLPRTLQTGLQQRHGGARPCVSAPSKPGKIIPLLTPNTNRRSYILIYSFIEPLLLLFCHIVSKSMIIRRRRRTCLKQFTSSGPLRKQTLKLKMLPLPPQAPHCLSGRKIPSNFPLQQLMFKWMQIPAQVSQTVATFWDQKKWHIWGDVYSLLHW